MIATFVAIRFPHAESLNEPKRPFIETRSNEQSKFTPQLHRSAIKSALQLKMRLSRLGVTAKTNWELPPVFA
jgi:hypothetical protein